MVASIFKKKLSKVSNGSAGIRTSYYKGKTVGAGATNERAIEQLP